MTNSIAQSGRWLPTATAANVPTTPLIWADFDGASTAVIGRRRYATVCRCKAGWMARLQGWMWQARPEEGAHRFGIGETKPRLFRTRDEAKAAVDAAWATPRNKAA